MNERPINPPEPEYLSRSQLDALDRAEVEFKASNRDRARRRAMARDLVEAIAEGASEITDAYIRETLHGDTGHVLLAVSEALEPYVQGYLEDWWEEEAKRVEDEMFAPRLESDRWED